MNWTQAFRNRSTTITTTFLTDETVEVPTGSVTVVVKDSAGTTVSTGTATASGPAWSYVVPGQPTLRPLVAHWTCTIAGQARENLTYIEVAGGAVFELPDLRSDQAFAQQISAYPTAALRNARWYAESRVEEFLGYCIVPRYFTCVRNGITARFNRRTNRSEVALPVQNFRALTLVSVDGTSLDVSLFNVHPHKLAGPPGIFGVGVQSVEIEGEQGADYPQGDEVSAAIRLARHFLLQGTSTLPDRLATMTNEFGTNQLNTANVGAPRYVSGHAGAPVAARPTGLPDVDAILVQRAGRIPGMAYE